MKCIHCTNTAKHGNLCYPHWLATRTPRMNWEVEFDKKFLEKQLETTDA